MSEKTIRVFGGDVAYIDFFETITTGQHCRKALRGSRRTPGARPLGTSCRHPGAPVGWYWCRPGNPSRFSRFSQACGSTVMDVITGDQSENRREMQQHMLATVGAFAILIAVAVVAPLL
jgi:hypothetical protein